MTGEMIKSDVTEEAFPVHFAIAKALGGTVEPFDQYQGPYVVIGRDIRVGSEPYATAPTGLGIKRLWLCSLDGTVCTIYNEATDKTSDAFLWGDDSTIEEAINAARSVL